jgi:hypothetical protein
MHVDYKSLYISTLSRVQTMSSLDVDRGKMPSHFFPSEFANITSKQASEEERRRQKEKERKINPGRISRKCKVKKNSKGSAREGLHPLSYSIV